MTKNQTYQQLEQDFITYQDLNQPKKVDRRRDQEKFVTLPAAGRELIGRYLYLRDMEQTIANIVVRDSVYKKLQFVDRELKKINSNWQLIVTYGYRSLEIQTAAFDQQLALARQANPDATPDQLLEITHRSIAVPSVAGHPTGGAVDVIIYDLQRQAYLDFGTPIGDLSTRDAYTFSPYVSPAAQQNRQTLRDLMLAQNFAPYNGEWWHFSYGDREWASYYDQSQVFYDQKNSSDLAFVDKFRAISSQPKSKEVLRIAMQKKGRLTEETFKLFAQAGLEVESYQQQLFGQCRNFPIELLFVRDDDIPQLVDTGIADLGVIGENIYLESRSVSQKIMNLHFGYCSLVLAVPNDSAIKTTADLAGKKIATSYPNSTRDFFTNQGLEVQIVEIAGSVEICPMIGYADAIVDLTATGSSLKKNKLITLQKILDSQSILIAQPNLSAAKKKILERLVLRLNSSLTAKKYKYVMMNAPRSILDQVRDLTPGLKSPTIAELAGNPDWCSIQTVIDEDIFWNTVENLKKIGATGIIVLPIEKIIK